MTTHQLTIVMSFFCSILVGACATTQADANETEAASEQHISEAQTEVETEAQPAPSTHAKVEPHAKPKPEQGAINLCEAYDSCDACIAGQQARGNSLGEAQTQCGLAVTGCWTTWDKPVVCGGATHDDSSKS